MKNCLLELKDKILLRKRSVIETINKGLKTFVKLNIRDIEVLKTLFLIPFKIKLQG